VLLPDILVFELGNGNGFGTPVGPAGGPLGKQFLGNGRRLRDAVIHAEVGLLTNNAVTTDNVDDDNGTKITDGNNGTTAAFPYIGPPNSPGTPLPGTQPPP
jgi:hypothetical protein